MSRIRNTAIEADGLEPWLDRYRDSLGLAEDSMPVLAFRALARDGFRPEESARALDVLEALEPLSPDSATVSAALVLPVLAARGEIPAQVREALSPEVRELLSQLERVLHYGRAYLPDDQQRAEGLRRLLLALVADVRVVLLALAWQLARLRRAAGEDAATRTALARETRLIHAPLANRLGIWQFKWELEDLAFSFLEPEDYRRISRQVDEKRADREAFVNRFIERLQELVDGAGIRGRVSGRIKHIYSIWRKMQRKGLDFHELYDVRAVRVLVDSVADCYSVLGLVHTHWQPIAGEFDDYITNPKPNLYQSLHTAVIGKEGRVVEVQIRTREMHLHAELGVAAHWRYKEGGPRDESFDKRIGVMRQLLEADESDGAGLLEHFTNLTTEDRVYVLTPRGEVMDLPDGATVVDFAYHVHTEVGHRCRGARINGRIVPLNTRLANGDRVEILTAKQPRPSRDWLNPGLGYIRTGRARAKVRQWFRQANYEENLAAGRQAIESELKRLNLDDLELARVAARFNFQNTDDLAASVGAGEMTAAQIAQAVARLHEAAAPAESLPLRKSLPARGARPGEIHIEGVGNLMHQLARCCRPVPGDEIAGYVTRTRGVSIHRSDCGQYLRLGQLHPERRIEVAWGREARREYPVDLMIAAWDRKGLIKDISSLLAAEGVGVSAIRAGRGGSPEEVEIELTVLVADLGQLSGLLAHMQGVPNISHVRRLS